MCILNPAYLVAKNNVPCRFHVFSSPRVWKPVVSDGAEAGTSHRIRLEHKHYQTDNQQNILVLVSL